MEDFYKKPYFDSLKWLIDNYSTLQLSDKEFLLLLHIEFLKSSNLPISYEGLLKRMDIANSDFDQLIANLVEKKYLKLGSDINGLVFDTSAVFEYEVEDISLTNEGDVFDLLAEVFGHPLSSVELVKISDLLKEFGQSQLIEAVRVAEANRVMKLAYIEKVLRNNEKGQQQNS